LNLKIEPQVKNLPILKIGNHKRKYNYNSNTRNCTTTVTKANAAHDSLLKLTHA